MDGGREPSAPEPSIGQKGFNRIDESGRLENVVVGEPRQDRETRLGHAAAIEAAVSLYSPMSQHMAGGTRKSSSRGR
jgi:hypothetical protein